MLSSGQVSIAERLIAWLGPKPVGNKFYGLSWKWLWRWKRVTDAW